MTSERHEIERTASEGITKLVHPCCYLTKWRWLMLPLHQLPAACHVSLFSPIGIRDSQRSGKNILPKRVKHICVDPCAMYAFVSVSHPDEIKDRKRQGKLRQHAIRNGIQRSRAERAKKDGVFVPVEMDGRTTQATKRSSDSVALTKAPSVSLLDPVRHAVWLPRKASDSHATS